VGCSIWFIGYSLFYLRIKFLSQAILSFFDHRLHCAFVTDHPSTNLNCLTTTASSPPRYLLVIPSNCQVPSTCWRKLCQQEVCVCSRTASPDGHARVVERARLVGDACYRIVDNSLLCVNFKVWALALPEVRILRVSTCCVSLEILCSATTSASSVWVPWLLNDSIFISCTCSHLVSSAINHNNQQAN